MYTASVEAINEMLPDAPEGPSDESYRDLGLPADGADA